MTVNWMALKIFLGGAAYVSNHPGPRLRYGALSKKL